MDDQSTEIHTVRKSKSSAMRGYLGGLPKCRQVATTQITLSPAIPNGRP
jgi:hypothetical protein